MKASELRIGNLLYQEQTIDDWEVKSVLAGTIIQCEINPDGFEPIPLTEEWFLKFEGFYKDEEYLSININDYKYCFKYRDWANNWAFYQEFTDSPFPEDEGKKHPVSFDIKYVHQLQNLYFALQHEELITKNKQNE